MGYFFGIVLTILAIFLILLVLVQRGRGGGLAGALGGMGGSSAFGAKAGDVFTRITIVVASIWIVICLLAFHWAKHRGGLLGDSSGGAAQSSLPAMPVAPVQDPGAPPITTQPRPSPGTAEASKTTDEKTTPTPPAGEDKQPAK
jgi:preprotein translocase subunit SecG